MELGIKSYNFPPVILGKLPKFFEPHSPHYKLGVPTNRVAMRVKLINQDIGLSPL